MSNPIHRAQRVDQLRTPELMAMFNISRAEVYDAIPNDKLGSLPADYHEEAEFLAAFRHLTKDLRDVLYRIVFDKQTFTEVARDLGTTAPVAYRLYEIAQEQIAQRIS
jgi:hypothetical protein